MAAVQGSMTAKAGRTRGSKAGSSPSIRPKYRSNKPVNARAACRAVKMPPNSRVKCWSRRKAWSPVARALPAWSSMMTGLSISRQVAITAP